MLKTALTTTAIALALAVGVVQMTAFAQDNGAQDNDRDAACFATLNTGGGATLFNNCISRHGNMTSWTSPAGTQDQIFAGAVREGYAICSSTGTHGWDSADGEAGMIDGGVATPLIIQPGGPNTLPLTVTRRTSDGAFELKQTYAKDKTEIDFTITMTLKAIGGPRLAVALARLYDADYGPGGGGNEIYDRTLDSVSAHSVDRSMGLSLLALTYGTPHVTSIETFGGTNPSLCTQPSIASPTASGDFNGRVTYNIGNMNGGKSKALKFKYSRW